MNKNLPIEIHATTAVMLAEVAADYSAKTAGVTGAKMLKDARVKLILSQRTEHGDALTKCNGDGGLQACRVQEQRQMQPA